MWTERSWKQEVLLISTIYILVNASKQVTMKILKYKEAHNLQTTQIIIKGKPTDKSTYSTNADSKILTTSCRK